MERIKKLFVWCFLAIVFCSSCQVKVESAGFDEPENPNPVAPEAWSGVEAGFHAAFGSVDQRYDYALSPEENLGDEWLGSAWKGERVNLQLVLWSADPVAEIEVELSELAGPDGQIIAAKSLGVHPVRYVITDEFLNGCGWRDKDTIAAFLAADILETNQVFNLKERTTRPVWLTIDVPASAVAGVYTGSVNVSHRGGRDVQLPVSLEVQNMELPAPADWSFHLDLWQNPFAVARYYDVELWSDKHLELMKPYLEMLADAGQKCITTSILHRPWGGQTYDQFESMIQWTHKGNQEWEFDYSIFDQWVELAMDAGITKQINCYSMVPWGNQVRYFDTDSADYVTVEVTPGSKEYKAVWEPFLVQFRNHLAQKGWLDKTLIAMDERKLEEMQSMIELLKRVTPEIKIALAGTYHAEITDDLYDLCVFHDPELEKQYIQARAEKGQITTFYTMCSKPEHPNNFTFSPPAEQALLGWYAAARGFDGFLRWAYNSWVEDPLHDSRYRTWPAGDTYQVYPGPLSSIRFERLREGIQDFEKIRIVREKLEAANKLDQLAKLDDALAAFSAETITKPQATKLVNAGKEVLDELVIDLLEQ